MSELILNKNYTAIVDDNCPSLAFNWSAHKITHKDKSYVYGRRQFSEKDGYPEYTGKHILLHRFIMRQTDPDMLVDHHNQITLDNRKANLRLVSRSQNGRNNTTKRGASGYLGVNLDRGRIVVRHKMNGKLKHIGIFKTLIDGANAYDNYVRTNTDRIGNVNFPIPGDANYIIPLDSAL